MKTYPGNLLTEAWRPDDTMPLLHTHHPVTQRLALILGIGVIIALQQIGISTDIILVLVAAVAFGTALALALAAGLGSVPIARQVSAGRHVHRRYEPGDKVRIGDVEGSVTEIGLSTTRIQVSDHRSMDVPNAEFLGAAVTVETGSPDS